MVAAHAHWGIRGGIVIVNIYMDVELGLAGGHLGMLWRAVEYVGQLNELGYEWAIVGGFNMGIEELNYNGWVEMIGGHATRSDEPTCIKANPSTHIDLIVSIVAL